jgi:hypothetical protein
MVYYLTINLLANCIIINFNNLNAAVKTILIAAFMSRFNLAKLLS